MAPAAFRLNYNCLELISMIAQITHIIFIVKFQMMKKIVTEQHTSAVQRFILLGK